ncbi:MAG TPA: sugar ABC transporter permease [Treponemataceae bacterium]|nr:sugar ABC transporter permease [Treponemataceae bacterium]
MKRFSQLTYARQQRVVAAVFLAVPLALVAIFGYLPFFSMIEYSFLRWDGLSSKEFIGLANYVDALTRVENFRVFFVSLYYFGASFIQLGLALFFATVLSFKVKGHSFFKGVLFFPNLINGVAIGLVFLYFYKDTGTLNTFLKLLGIDSDVLWLTNPSLVNYSIAATSVWRYMGYNMVMFLGAIQSIPSDIYEAAEIDGANKWQIFWRIIFLSILPIIELMVILSITGSLSVFETPYIMTGGGNGSETFVIRTVNTAFSFNKFGLASAMAMILTAIVLTVTFVQKKIFKER